MQKINWVSGLLRYLKEHEFKKFNENVFLQDASRQKRTGRTRTDFVMKEEE